MMQQAVAECMADARMAEAKAKILQTAQVQLNSSIGELAELRTTPGHKAAIHGKSLFLQYMLLHMLPDILIYFITLCLTVTS